MPLCTLSFVVVTLQCISLLRGHLLAGKLYFERLLFCRELFSFLPRDTTRFAFGHLRSAACFCYCSFFSDFTLVSRLFLERSPPFF